MHDGAAVDRHRAGGLDAQAVIAVVVRELALQTGRDAGHLIPRLLEADARLQPADAHQPLASAERDPPQIVAIGIGGDRHPQALLLERVSGEVRMATPITVKGRPFSRTVRPMIAGRAVELRLPQPMADHDDGARLIEALVVRREPAPARHRHAEHVEVVGRDEGADDRHGFLPGAQAELCQPADVIRRETLRRPSAGRDSRDSSDTRRC